MYTKYQKAKIEEMADEYRKKWGGERFCLVWSDSIEEYLLFR